MKHKIVRGLLGLLAGFLVNGSIALARPMPSGTSTTTISYTTTSGEKSFSQSSNDYTGRNLSDADLLGAAPNVMSFNSVNIFGRRTFLATGGAPVLDAESESLVTHAFFKGDNNDDFFPNVTADSMVTVKVDNIVFDQPVFVDHSTVLLHALWRANQVDLFPIEGRYENLHNHHTISGSFRDFDAFVGPVFRTSIATGVPNYVVPNQDVTFTVEGSGTNTLNIELIFPYSLLTNLEETGQVVPDGLPAPHGTLEPFHFHVEYVVTPEPTTLTLLGMAAWATLHRRRRRA